MGGRRVRQRPGPQNALGSEIHFPNSHIILCMIRHQKAYLIEKRAFSHGCIRLAP
jgi:murein L,D-transpeptidase YcbB/YkuD